MTTQDQFNWQITQPRQFSFQLFGTGRITDHRLRAGIRKKASKGDPLAGQA